jgi:hypothetical protein
MFQTRFWSCASALALASVLFAHAPDALAFCRTTTEPAPPDYNSADNGCWSERPNGGVPLFWRNACVGYSIQRDGSRKISYEDASNAISTAFTRWTGATCPTPGSGRSRTSIDVRDLGPAACNKVEYDKKGGPNQNVVVFRDDSWTHGEEVLGLTIVNFNPANGEIYNADMEINTFDMYPLAVRDPVEPGAFDFLSVVTHEAGHFLGIAHSDIAGATMYARYNRGETSMRNLSPDDVLAICSVYRPNGERPVLNGSVFKDAECNPTPRGGYTKECIEPPGCFKSSASPSKPVAPLAWVGALGGLLLARRIRRRR